MGDELELEAVDVARRAFRLLRRLLAPVAATTPTSDRPEVLAQLEAQARGFKHTEAFLAWCRTRGVPVREDGAKVRWVCSADVSRAVRGLPVGDAPANDTPEAQAREALRLMDEGG